MNKLKDFRLTVLLIPIMFTVFALMGWGFFYRVVVSSSCAIILWLMMKRFTDNSKWYVIVALLVSICGDWFLSHSRGVPVRFIYGVCLFFVAHLGYVAFCLKNGRINLYVLFPMLTGFLIFFFVALRPALSEPVLFVAILAYLLVSCLSFAVATGLRFKPVAKWCFSFGIALIVFSDTLIALKDFVGNKSLSYLILPTYFGSHIVITLALLLEDSKRK